jgi:poly-gamma-glutamate capsule biosynthesis protein CapA/YwtB (metallophosphatase superfamily)
MHNKHKFMLFRILANIGVLLIGAVAVVLPHSLSSEPPAHYVEALIVAPSIRLLFIGDLFFDRSVRQYQEANGVDYVLSCADPLFAKADVVVGNLEGPITDKASVSVGSVADSPRHFTFTFASTTAELLKRHGISIVTLGNNHIQNFGNKGIASTHQYLSQAGVEYFGGVAGNEPVERSDSNDVPLSFVGYNQFGGATPDKVAETIFNEKAAGRIVIVFAHWGEEYFASSTKAQRLAAHTFIDAGADFVVGSHPHVVEPSEMYHGKLIYYSLGNFVFDQYFDPAVMRGLTVLATITKEGEIQTSEYPVALGRDRRTCPLDTDHLDGLASTTPLL